MNEEKSNDNHFEMTSVFDDINIIVGRQAKDLHIYVKDIYRPMIEIFRNHPMNLRKLFSGYLFEATVNNKPSRL